MPHLLSSSGINCALSAYLAIPRYLSFDLGRIGARLGVDVRKYNADNAMLTSAEEMLMLKMMDGRLACKVWLFSPQEVVVDAVFPCLFEYA